MTIPSRILAGVAITELLLAGPEISSAVGAYDNGVLTILAPIISYGIAFIGPVWVIASIVVAMAIWILALVSNLGVLVVGDSLGSAKTIAIVILYVLSALVFVGLLLAITNFGHAFFKGTDAGREPIWALAFPIAFSLIARLY
jgi:hypothetical protein